MARLRSVGRYNVEDQTIGKGNFAVVELATHTVTKTKVALKVIDKRKISKPYVKRNLCREARIMSQLRHPNIVRLYETITSSSLYCLVLDYVPGGDLLSFVRGQKGGRLREGTARRFVRQLVSALHHMHEHGIVHRDLKMENIMLDKKRESVKIIDFGLSNQCDADQLFKTHCGSPEYAAPELFIADRDYGPEVDIWSLGVNVFAMVTGKLPFTTPHTENRRQHLLVQIRKGLRELHEKEMEHLTDDCKDLLHGCIEPVPEDRLPLFDIELHAWITCEGQEPFCSFQAPPPDVELRGSVIEEMALRLKVSPNKIQDVAQEDHLDEVSAIFNIMLNEHLSKRSEWSGDHTRPAEILPLDSPVPCTGRRSGSRASSNRPESACTYSVAPTVVSMVRPSLKTPERRSAKTVDFELDVVESEQLPWAERTGNQTGLPPPWSKKNRPLGNATTVNRVKARTYRAGTPGMSGPSLTTCDHEPNMAHTDLLCGSTIHILVPTPSFESQPVSQVDIKPINPLDVVLPATSAKTRRKPRATRKAAVGGAPKTRKPITNVRVSFRETHDDKGGKDSNKKENKCHLADDQSIGNSKEIKVVDMKYNLVSKQQKHHGYQVEETQITQRLKPKEVRLCVAHREFLEDGRAPRGGRSAAPPYGSSRPPRDSDKELMLTPRQNSSTTESCNAVSPERTTSEAPSPSPTKPFYPAFQPKNSGRRSLDTASTLSTITAVSPRSILHPSIASIHGSKESAAILSHFSILRCANKTHGANKKHSKDRPSTTGKKGETEEKKRGEKGKARGPVKSAPDQRVCRQTNVEFTDNKEVKGQKFTMFNGIQPMTNHKRYIRRSPQHSSKPSPNVQHLGARSTPVNARVLRPDDVPSKFIQKFGANRSKSPLGSKDLHRHCKVPTFGYVKDKLQARSPSPGTRSVVSRSASPLRRVVDISEQAMDSLVNEAIRDKKRRGTVSGDLIKRHYTERLKPQRKSPVYEMYPRFVPMQVRPKTGREKGTIRPTTSPAPTISPTKDVVFNILDTIPPYAFFSQPSTPSASSSTPPPPGPKPSPDARQKTGRVPKATVTDVQNAVSAGGNEQQNTSEVKEWDTAYLLERKISDTVKGAAYVGSRTEQRTRAWVADMASEYAAIASAGTTAHPSQANDE